MRVGYFITGNVSASSGHIRARNSLSLCVARAGGCGWLTWGGAESERGCVTRSLAVTFDCASQLCEVCVRCWSLCSLFVITSSRVDVMEFYAYQPQQCSPLSTSSQTSSSSSDDELGLKGLVQGVYAPYLTAELERLFVAEVSLWPIYLVLLLVVIFN